MPTKGFYIKAENYQYLIARSEEADCSMSEYLNRLIYQDSDDFAVHEVVKEWTSKKTTPLKKIEDVAPEKIEKTLEELRDIPGIIDLKKVALKKKNPNSCPKCGQIKVAGQCMHCKGKKG